VRLFHLISVLLEIVCELDDGNQSALMRIFRLMRYDETQIGAFAPANLTLIPMVTGLKLVPLAATQKS
jgi:hypothetical protein